MKPLSLIVTLSDNYIIGRNGKVPWRYPSDVEHFHKKTTGHICIMGRKTYDCLETGLPNRGKYIISRTCARPAVTGVRWWDSLDAAITYAQSLDAEPFICGGQSIYFQAIKRCTKMYITYIARKFEGDRHFSFSLVDWICTGRRCEGDLCFEVWERV